MSARNNSEYGQPVEGNNRGYDASGQPSDSGRWADSRDQTLMSLSTSPIHQSVSSPAAPIETLYPLLERDFRAHLPASTHMQAREDSGDGPDDMDDASSPAGAHGFSDSILDTSMESVSGIGNGGEHIGRWTHLEHTRFLEGLKLYGKVCLILRLHIYLNKVELIRCQ